MLWETKETQLEISLKGICHGFVLCFLKMRGVMTSGYPFGLHNLKID